ncbi:hypothetical protein [Alteromonas naphthalenivorans]|uniref:Uncharacterized protein n=1 Tax=Alteromonas naphthalenivorans TaxID=715451 RepID=F5ZCR3_ALTNA|nr:hypothetical protein [Alteromonas naphthalenivorans]AEF02812.1 hypothetical protein ambt_06375 [Alteromonas naphthalenivorans]
MTVTFEVATANTETTIKVKGDGLKEHFNEKRRQTTALLTQSNVCKLTLLIEKKNVK